MKKKSQTQGVDLFEKGRDELRLSGRDMTRELGLEHDYSWQRLKKGGRVRQETLIRLAEMLGAERFVKLLRRYGRIGP